MSGAHRGVAVVRRVLRRSRPLGRLARGLVRRTEHLPMVHGALTRLRSVVPKAAGVPALPADPGLVAHLGAARWSGDRLELQGWAFTDGAGELSLVAVGGRGAPVPLDVEPRVDPTINAQLDQEEVDRSGAGFTAVLDPTSWPDAPTTWAIEVRLELADRTLASRFQTRDTTGSAGRLRTRISGSGECIELGWSNRSGLHLTRRPAEVTGAVVQRDGATGIRLTGLDGWIRGAVVEGEDWSVPLGRPRHGVLSIPTDGMGGPTTGAGTLVLTTGSRRRTVRCGHEPVTVGTGAGVVRVGRDDAGQLTLRQSEAVLLVERVEVVPTGAGGSELTVGGRSWGWSEADHELRIEGLQQQVVLDVGVGDDGSFTATAILSGRLPWADAATTLLPGSYRLVGTGVDVEVAPALADQLPVTHLLPDARIRVEARGASARLHVGAPRRTDEIGVFHRKRMVAGQSSRLPAAEAVYFESFSGRSTNDNSRAVYEELRRRDTGLSAVWGVADHSVAVPDGAERLLLGSASWWRRTRECRAVVVNNWLTGSYRRPEHQYVLQTWHGTPYKTLGADRLGSGDREQYLRQLARTTNRWDALVVQNEYSAEKLCAAYGYTGAVLRSGYPRNDGLVAPTESRRTAIRTRLGLQADDVAILYAPTWREDDRTINRGLDPAELLGQLGPGHRLLLRGHASVVRHNRPTTADGVIDVSLYPDVSELMVAADVLVTDYSSIMFDWTITGKPIVYFVPDLERYSSELRGTYFDLAAEAPGPLLVTTSDVAEHIAQPSDWGQGYAERYRIWQGRYHPWDDGRAAARVVDHLLDGIDRRRT